MSPCQVPSELRRMTLTTPSSVVRSEVVAQWPITVCLCGMVTSRPSTLGVADRPRMTSSRAD